MNNSIDIKNSNSSWISENPKKTGLIIFTLTLLISLFIIDWFLHYLRPNEQYEESYIIRQINLREHPPGIKTIKYLNGQGYHFRTDDNGFILPHNNHENPDYKIVFMGGSTTECMYVSETSRFPYLTEQLLEENTGKLINVFNAAVAGNNAIHSLDILLNKIIPMNPDIVVFMHAINDYTTLAYDHTYWPVGTSRSVVIKLRDYYLKRGYGAFFSHFKGLIRSIYPNIYQRIFDLKQRFLNPAKQIEQQDEWAGRRNHVVSRNFYSMKQDFEWALNMLIFTAKSKGIVPILMTQANIFGTIPDDKVPDGTALVIKAGLKYSDFKKEYSIFNDITRKVAKENEVYLIDLENIIPQDSAYFYDQVHYNEKGSKYVASIISEHLINIINSLEN
ncbi:MAG: hypothetical protein GWP19_14685, partial [Planctomycetia bacterium]|nr:hypothetical protein [Planctomycetia bacterium]